MWIQIDHPVPPGDSDELLEVAEFYQAIVEGVATRYPGRASTLVIALKKVPEEAQRHLSEHGWTFSFEDGLWRACAPGSNAARQAG